MSYFVAEVSNWSSTASLMKLIEAETVDCLRSFSKYKSYTQKLCAEYSTIVIIPDYIVIYST